MKSLTETTTNVLEWRASNPPGSGFDLDSSEGRHATLRWSAADTLARVETPEGSWTFLRRGGLGKHVTLREEGSHINLAEYHPHLFGKGKLAFADGAAFLWTHLPHHDGWAFQDLDGHELLRIQPWPEAPRHVPEPGMVLGRVLTEGKGLALWRHALLASLGWYLLQLAKHDAEAQEGALTGSNLI